MSGVAEGENVGRSQRIDSVGQFVVSLIVTEAWMAAWGVFFTLAASGDFLVLWLIRDLERATWIIDHTSRCGCAIVEGGVEP